MGSAVILGAEPARRRRSKRTAAPVEVVASARAYDAHQLRLAGLDWAEIAQRVGYLDGRIASMAVNAMLQKAAAEQSHHHRRQALELELARLDQLQSAYYPVAMAGDMMSAMFVLRVITRRCAIVAFDRIDDDLAASPRTVVIGGTSEQYIASLKAVAEGTVMGAPR